MIPIPFYALADASAWLAAAAELTAALDAGDRAAALRAHPKLGRALVAAGAADLAHAAARHLLWREGPLSEALRAAPAAPAGLRAGARADLARLQALLQRPLDDELRALVAADTPAEPSPRPPGAAPGGLPDAAAGAGAPEVPSLRELAPVSREVEAQWREALASDPPEALLARLEARYRAHGAGPLAAYAAYRWTAGELHPIPHPRAPTDTVLVGVERQLERLERNVRAFLGGRPALPTLLYGPRGSGKSTAVRALLPRHHDAGLRLVELAPERLDELPAVLERLRGRPQRFVLFVDDLAFEAGDARYRPLKSLLEGTLTAAPDNALLVATSNRRHLVSERRSERPDPLDDDVHAWDTHHERLALADRFGLAITFPDADQRRFLRIVRELAVRAGVAQEGEALEALEREAVRFAEWGNGYSGRTAAQFLASYRQRA